MTAALFTSSFRSQANKEAAISTARAGKEFWATEMRTHPDRAGGHGQRSDGESGCSPELPRRRGARRERVVGAPDGGMRERREGPGGRSRNGKKALNSGNRPDRTGRLPG
ncbi:hypothetical protein Hesp01_23140 [Herbidospora sp. NBRC 101105]|nr:hypothetical protein Hesp01_23140 [Herbidospora sp. NBRC 101105]